jgi:hypothetical protein
LGQHASLSFFPFLNRILISQFETTVTIITSPARLQPWIYTLGPQLVQSLHVDVALAFSRAAAITLDYPHTSSTLTYRPATSIFSLRDWCEALTSDLAFAHPPASLTPVGNRHEALNFQCLH